MNPLCGSGLWFVDSDAWERFRPWPGFREDGDVTAGDAAASTVGLQHWFWGNKPSTMTRSSPAASKQGLRQRQLHAITVLVEGPPVSMTNKGCDPQIPARKRIGRHLS